MITKHGVSFVPNKKGIISGAAHRMRDDLISMKWSGNEGHAPTLHLGCNIVIGDAKNHITVSEHPGDWNDSIQWPGGDTSLCGSRFNMLGLNSQGHLVTAPVYLMGSEEHNEIECLPCEDIEITSRDENSIVMTAESGGEIFMYSDDIGTMNSPWAVVLAVGPDGEVVSTNKPYVYVLGDAEAGNYIGVSNFCGEGPCGIWLGTGYTNQPIGIFSNEGPIIIGGNNISPNNSYNTVLAITPNSYYEGDGYQIVSSNLYDVFVLGNNEGGNFIQVDNWGGNESYGSISLNARNTSVSLDADYGNLTLSGNNRVGINGPLYLSNCVNLPSQNNWYYLTVDSNGHVWVTDYHMPASQEPLLTRDRKDVKAFSMSKEAFAKIRSVAYVNNEKNVCEVGLLPADLCENAELSCLVKKDEQGNALAIDYNALTAIIADLLIKEQKMNEDNKKNINKLVKMMNEQKEELELLKKQILNKN